MKNFIFKSATADSDLQKIVSSLKLLLDEQRMQRVDLAYVKRCLNTLLVDKAVQKQVTDYYERDSDTSDEEDPPEQ